MKVKIGIDINGVLSDNKVPDYQTRDYSIFSVMKDAVKIVRKMVDAYGADNIYIISRVRTHQLSMVTGVWLEYHGILKKTGIPLENVFICYKLKDKAELAAKLELTHFIDDRLEVLDYFSKKINLIAFQPTKYAIKKYPDTAARSVVVNSWSEVELYFKI